MVRNLEDFIEEFKMKFNYGVVVRYGHETGGYDFNDPVEERPIQIYGTPVGTLGGARIAWVGNLKLLRDYDLNATIPVKVNNPPSNEEIREPGLYVWGEMADTAIEKWS